MDLAAVADDLAGYLDEARFRYALVGALGLHAYGVTRATQDLDLVTEYAAQPGLLAHLAGRGYELLHASEGYSNHLHQDPARGRVDIIYVDEPTARRLFDSCVGTVELGRRTLRVPRPEHLAAMKVHAMRNNPRRRLRDMSDIQELMRATPIDRELVRKYFEDAGLIEDFREIEKSL